MKEFTPKKIAALAVMAALIVCGKLALDFIANVEVVSLFCALFGYVFGLCAIIPTTVFCLISGAFWGYNLWVITYLIHFNSIVVVFWLLSKKSLKKPYITAPIICVMTFLFGVLDAFTVTIISGLDNFFYRFFVYYFRGIAFVIVHVVSNVIVFILLFNLLENLLQKIKFKLKL